MQKNSINASMMFINTDPSPSLSNQHPNKIDSKDSKKELIISKLSSSEIEKSDLKTKPIREIIRILYKTFLTQEDEDKILAEYYPISSDSKMKFFVKEQLTTPQGNDTEGGINNMTPNPSDDRCHSGSNKKKKNEFKNNPNTPGNPEDEGKNKQVIENENSQYYRKKSTPECKTYIDPLSLDNKGLNFSNYLEIGALESIDFYFLNKGKNKQNNQGLKDNLSSDNESKVAAWRRIVGDGNCFYVGVLVNYLENILLVCQNTKSNISLISLIYDIYFTDFNNEGIKNFNSKNKVVDINSHCNDNNYLYNLYDNYSLEYLNNKYKLISVLVKLLSFVDLILENEKYSFVGYDFLYRIFNDSDNDNINGGNYNCASDSSLIRTTLVHYLRMKLSQFLILNYNSQINGLPIIMAISDIDASNLNDDQIQDLVGKFIHTSVLKKEEYAEGILLYLTAIVLKTQINTYQFNSQFKLIKESLLSKEDINTIDNNDCCLYNFKDNGDVSCGVIFNGNHYDVVYDEKVLNKLKLAYLPYLKNFYIGKDNSPNEYERYMNEIRNKNLIKKNLKNKLNIIFNNKKENNDSQRNILQNHENLNKVYDNKIKSSLNNNKEIDEYNINRIDTIQNIDILSKNKGIDNNNNIISSNKKISNKEIDINQFEESDIVVKYTQCDNCEEIDNESLLVKFNCKHKLCLICYNFFFEAINKSINIYTASRQDIIKCVDLYNKNQISKREVLFSCLIKAMSHNNRDKKYLFCIDFNKVKLMSIIDQFLSIRNQFCSLQHYKKTRLLTQLEYYKNYIHNRDKVNLMERYCDGCKKIENHFTSACIHKKGVCMNCVDSFLHNTSDKIEKKNIADKGKLLYIDSFPFVVNKKNIHLITLKSYLCNCYFSIEDFSNLYKKVFLEGQCTLAISYVESIDINEKKYL